MLELQSSYRRPIRLPSDFVFSLIADFEHHHFKWTPPNVEHPQVLEGGYGNGTIISCTLHVGSWQQQAILRISEPIPGKVLVLASSATRSLTIYRVRDELHGCTVEHALDSRIAGDHGWLDRRILLPWRRRQFHRQSLINLERYAYQIWNERQREQR